MLINSFTQALHLLLTGDPSTYSAILTTLEASLSSLFLSLLIGLPLSFYLGYYHFPFKHFLMTIVNTCLALPTVVIGLLLYLIFSHQGPLNSLNLLFSVKAIIIGQTILALPIIIAFSSQAIENTSRGIKETVLTLGATKKQLAYTLFYEARFALAAAAIMAYGRVVSEVGIAMIVGGNIKWHTRTMTTAIALDTSRGDFTISIALGILLLAIALTINTLVIFFKHRSAKI